MDLDFGVELDLNIDDVADLVDDEKGSQWVVGREHKRAIQPKKDARMLLCIAYQDSLRTVKLSTSISGLKLILHHWRQQFTVERTRILDGSPSFLVSLQIVFNISIVTLLSC